MVVDLMALEEMMGEVLTVIPVQADVETLPVPFGDEDEGSIAGKVGSANTTQAGKSPSSDMGYGLQDAVQSQKTEYGGVLAGAIQVLKGMVLVIHHQD